MQKDGAYGHGFRQEKNSEYYTSKRVEQGKKKQYIKSLGKKRGGGRVV